MLDFEFLHDPATRAAIKDMVGAAASKWAPDEVDVVGLVTEKYLHRVRAAGELLYPTQARNAAFGIGNTDLWLLVVLPVVTGFMGNLLAAMGVMTIQALYHKVGARSPAEWLSAIDLSPERVKALIAPQARVMGLKEDQIEQLARLISTVLVTTLTTGPYANTQVMNDPPDSGSPGGALPTTGAGV